MRTFAKKAKATQQTTSAKSSKPSRSFGGRSRDVHSILDLQRTVGNQAVLRLLQTAKDNVDVSSANTASPGFTHNFNTIQEHSGGCSNIQRKVNGESEVSKEIEEAINRKRGGGQTLDKNLRRQMESAMGVEFRDVRVHTDGEANRLNQKLHAKAFTIGKDIFFGDSNYNPGNPTGHELIAHELTHVVQQRGGTTPHGKLELSQTGDRQEAEAHRAAQQVVSQGQMDVALTPVEQKLAGAWTTPRLNSVEWNEYDRLRTLVERQGYRFEVQAEDEHGPTSWSVTPIEGDAVTLTRDNILQQLAEWAREPAAGQGGAQTEPLPAWLDPLAARFVQQARAGSVRGPEVRTFGRRIEIERTYTNPENEQTTHIGMSTPNQVVWVGNGAVECFEFAPTDRSEYVNEGIFNSWQDWNYQMFNRVIGQQMQPSMARAQMMRMDEELGRWVTLTVAANAIGP